MTGPEHYREAERLLSAASLDDLGYDARPMDRANLAAAQVHATLALAAATALQQRGYTATDPDRQAWQAAASEGGAR